MDNITASEADLTALLNSDHTNEALLRSSGRIGEADQLAASRSSRMQTMRADLGLPPEPQAPDPVVTKAAEYGVHLEAKPGDYARADLSEFVRNLPPDRAANVKTQLSDFMAAIQIEPNSGAYLMQHLVKTSAELRAMSEEERGVWISNQERDATQMAARRGLTLDQLKANAKAILNSHPVGQHFAGSVLLSSPALLLLLDDHRQFVEAHRKSKGK
jgi:hypothetical protein